ncbi:MAG: aminotransferase class V-fold PLP-dependent enzyme [Elstera sp.]
MIPRLHFNHSAASPCPPEARAAIADHLALEQAIGPVEAAIAVAPRLAVMHRTAEALVGAAPGQVAFTEGQGRALSFVAGGLRLAPGDRILCAPSEWGGTVSAFEAVAAEAGATVEAIPMTPDHLTDLDALAKRLDERVKLVSITSVSVSGTAIQPVAAIAALAQTVGALVAVDASQSIGWLALDMRVQGIDIVTASGRKYLQGPRGVALLGLSARAQEVLHPPPPDDYSARQSDALRWESAEYSYATRLGFGAALDLRAATVALLGAELTATATRLEQALLTVPGLRLIRPNGGTTPAIAPLVAFEIAGQEPGAVQRALHGEGINIAANLASYAPYLFAALGRESLLRASVHQGIGDDEIDRLGAALKRLSA